MSLSWAAPDGDGVAAALVEGTLLKLYSFDRFKSSPSDDGEDGVESLEIAGDGVDGDEVERGRVVSEAANAARDLQNLPANVATPSFLAERATEIADAARGARGGAARPRGDRWLAAWARSRRWRRAPTWSRS